MTMTERLLEATKEIWDGYNEAPFVKGIADGSLDHEKFKYYIENFLILNIPCIVRLVLNKNKKGE